MKIDVQNKTINLLFIKMTFVTQQIIFDHNIIEISVSTMSDHVIDYRFDSEISAMRATRFDDFTEKETETIVILKWEQSSIWCRDCNDLCKRSINSNLLNAKVTTWFFKSFRCDLSKHAKIKSMKRIRFRIRISRKISRIRIIFEEKLRIRILTTNDVRYRRFRFFCSSNVHQTWSSLNTIILNNATIFESIFMKMITQKHIYELDINNDVSLFIDKRQSRCQTMTTTLDIWIRSLA